MRHIQLLLEYEKDRGPYSGNIWFQRTGKNTIAVSCNGYQHADLEKVSKELLKLGCRYDFSKNQIQEFDRLCGRTFVYFVEPKQGGSK